MWRKIWRDDASTEHYCDLERNSGAAGIPSAAVAISSGEQTVYNIEVHKDHVYFVSKLGVLVHNTYLRQSGGNVVKPNTAKVLQEEFGVSRDRLHTAIESMKRSERIPSSDHGNIF